MTSPSSAPDEIDAADPLRIWFRIIRLNRRATNAVAAELKALGLSIRKSIKEKSRRLIRMPIPVNQIWGRQERVLWIINCLGKSNALASGLNDVEGRLSPR